MDYRKPSVNDDKISFSLFSAMADRLSTTDTSRRNGKANIDTFSSCVVRVKNVSGEAVRQFRAMAIKEPTVKPPDNANPTSDEDKAKENEFKTSNCLSVDTPTDDDKGNWCVLLEPLPPDAIGWAVVSGVIQCRVNLVSESDKFVDVEDGEVIPKSGSAGYRIVWVRGGVGDADDTGEQWAYISLDGGGGDSVKILSIGGALELVMHFES